MLKSKKLSSSLIKLSNAIEEMRLFIKNSSSEKAQLLNDSMKTVSNNALNANTSVLNFFVKSEKLTDDEVSLSFLPLSHTYERECGHGISMMTASTIAYSSPVTIVGDLQIFKPHFFMAVPRIYERIYMTLKEQASNYNPQQKNPYIDYV